MFSLAKYQNSSPGAWLSLLVVIAGIVVASTAEISFLAKLPRWSRLVHDVGATRDYMSSWVQKYKPIISYKQKISVQHLRGTSDVILCRHVVVHAIPGAHTLTLLGSCHAAVQVHLERFLGSNGLECRGGAQDRWFFLWPLPKHTWFSSRVKTGRCSKDVRYDVTHSWNDWGQYG